MPRVGGSTLLQLVTAVAIVGVTHAWRYPTGRALMHPMPPAFAGPAGTSPVAITVASQRGAWRVPVVRTQRARVGMELVLTEENARAVLDECQTALAAVFGNNAEAQAVGITGKAEFVELDGPVVVVRLSGRFWHKRSTVLERISSFVIERIPECVAVEIEDEEQLNDAILPGDAV